MNRVFAVDSDGCALDAMEAKHRRCFTPSTIDIWGLHGIAEQVTHVSLWVNLYSRSRGLNRFIALNQVLRLLGADPETAPAIPDCGPLERWILSGCALAEESLRDYLREAPKADRPGLLACLDWTRLVNERIAALDSPAAFPGVRETLEQAVTGAEVFVVSSANRAAIEAEWSARGLGQYVSEFHGQESGSKAEVLVELAKAVDSPRSMLMVGDAWSDWQAAKVVNACFFPVQPGSEASSWRELRERILPAFLAGGEPGSMLGKCHKDFADSLKPLPEDACIKNGGR